MALLAAKGHHPRDRIRIDGTVNTAGVGGVAKFFDGIDDYLEGYAEAYYDFPSLGTGFEGNDEPGLALPGFSGFGWFYLSDGWSSKGTIWCFGDAAGSYEIKISVTSDRYLTFDFINFRPLTAYNLTGTTQLDTSEWYSFAFALIDDEVYIYVNAVLDNSETGIDMQFRDIDGGYTVGCANQDLLSNPIRSDFFSGGIGTVQFFPRQLSGNDVLGLHNQYYADRPLFKVPFTTEDLSIVTDTFRGLAPDVATFNATTLPFDTRFFNKDVILYPTIDLGLTERQFEGVEKSTFNQTDFNLTTETFLAPIDSTADSFRDYINRFASPQPFEYWPLDEDTATFVCNSGLDSGGTDLEYSVTADTAGYSQAQSGYFSINVDDQSKNFASDDGRRIDQGLGAGGIMDLPDEFTIEFAYNRRTSAAEQVLLRNGNAWIMEYIDSTRTIQFSCDIFLNPGTKVYTFATNAMSGSFNWNWLSLVGTASGLELYINNIPQGTVSITGSPWNDDSGGGTGIGGDWNSAQPWGGYLDEICLYGSNIGSAARDKNYNYWEFNAPQQPFNQRNLTFAERRAYGLAEYRTSTEEDFFLLEAPIHYWSLADDLGYSQRDLGSRDKPMENDGNTNETPGYLVTSLSASNFRQAKYIDSFERTFGSDQTDDVILENSFTIEFAFSMIGTYEGGAVVVLLDVYEDTTNTNQFSLVWDVDADTLVANMNNSGTIVTLSSDLSADGVAIGNGAHWIHVTGTTGGNIICYIDDVQTASVSITGTPWNATAETHSNIYIGLDFNETIYTDTSLVEYQHILIYDQVMGATARTEHYNMFKFATPSPATPTLYNYNFDAQSSPENSDWTFSSPSAGTTIAAANTAGRWCHDTNETTSTGVGPLSGAGGNPDGYIYTEMSSQTAGDVFIMEHNTNWDASANNYEFEFKWAARGDQANPDIFVETNENGAGWVTRLTTGSNQGAGDESIPATSSGTVPWYTKSVNLSSLISNSSTKIRIRIVNNVVSNTANMWHNDTGIDEIVITETPIGGGTYTPPEKFYPSVLPLWPQTFTDSSPVSFTQRNLTFQVRQFEAGDATAFAQVNIPISTRTFLFDDFAPFFQTNLTLSTNTFLQPQIEQFNQTNLTFSVNSFLANVDGDFLTEALTFTQNTFESDEAVIFGQDTYSLVESTFDSQIVQVVEFNQTDLTFTVRQFTIPVLFNTRQLSLAERLFSAIDTALFGQQNLSLTERTFASNSATEFGTVDLGLTTVSFQISGVTRFNTEEFTFTELPFTANESVVYGQDDLTFAVNSFLFNETAIFNTDEIDFTLRTFADFQGTVLPTDYIGYWTFDNLADSQLFNSTALPFVVDTFTTVEGATLPTDYIGYWTFDNIESGTIDDMAHRFNFDGSVNATTGTDNFTISGNSNYAVGRTGSAFSFDGSTYLSTANADEFNYNTYSVMFFMDVTTDISHTIIGTNYQENSGDNSLHGWRIRVNSNGGMSYAEWDDYISGVQGEQAVAVPAVITPPSRSWQHIAIVRDPSSIKFYVDGVLAGEGLTPVTNISSSPGKSKFYVSGRGRDTGVVEDGVGKIDDLRYFTRTVSEYEIGLHMALGEYTTETIDDMIHHYTGNSTAVDAVGCADLTGSIGYVTGLIGNAFSFSGTQQILSNLSDMRGKQEFSISLFMNMDVFASQTLMSVTNTQGTGETDGWRLRIASNGNITFNTFNDYISGSQGEVQSVGAVAVTSGWHHVAVTRSADGVMNFYYDGVLDATNSTNMTGGIGFTADTDLIVGARLNNGSYSDRIDGRLDDIRIYDRVLSLSEVNTHKTLGGI